MPARPLQALNFGEPTLQTINDKVWAIVRFNYNESKPEYSFKANTFRAQFKSITGAKEGDDLFLIGNFANSGGGEAFDINLGYKDGKKVDDKKALEELDRKWTMDLMPIICHANGIDSFEILAEVAAEHKLIFVDLNIDTHQFQCVKLENKAQLKSMLTELAFTWIAAYEENPGKPYEHKEKGDRINELGEELNKYGLFYVPLCAVNDPQIESCKATSGGTRFKPEIKFALPPIKGEELCPYESLDVALPSVKKKSNWSGSKNETTLESLKAREDYLINKFKIDGCETLEDIYRAITPEKQRGSETYFRFLIDVIG